MYPFNTTLLKADYSEYESEEESVILLLKLRIDPYSYGTPACGAHGVSSTQRFKEKFNEQHCIFGLLVPEVAFPQIVHPIEYCLDRSLMLEGRR